MAAFVSLDKRIRRDVDELHDFLWQPRWTGDGPRLLARLATEARDLDAFLRAGARLRRHGERLARLAAKDQARFGPTLFELMNDVYNLAASVEHLRKGDPRGATDHVVSLVESGSIGTCVSLDSFPLVAEWESGKIDFESYASRLADLLEARGVSGAGQYKRMLLVARTFGTEWDPSAPAPRRRLSARAAIAAAAWCAVASRVVRHKATRGTPDVPISDFAEIVEKALARL